MLLLEFFGVSVLVGSVLGVVWRVADNWWEKRQANKLLELQNPTG